VRKTFSNCEDFSIKFENEEKIILVGKQKWHLFLEPGIKGGAWRVVTVE
jgi:hypothetical protein